MKHTKEEFVEMLNSAFGEGGPYDDRVVDVQTSGEDLVFSVGQQYKPPELTVSTLNAVAAFVGTDTIDIGSESESGCETCDFGSCYSVVLTVRGGAGLLA